jgi:predicted nucleotide-binding protein
MGIDWEKTPPNPQLDDFSKSLVREIAEHFVKTGTGVPDHAKKVELGKRRHLLNTLVQKGFVSNISNKFYPAFAGLYFLSPKLRARFEEATEWVLRACQALYKDGGGQTFSLEEIADQIRKLASQSVLTAVQTARRGMLFTRDFTNYFGSNFEYSDDAPIKGATVWENILDFEDLQHAWEEEVARRYPKASSPSSEPLAKAAEHENSPKEIESSQDKLKKVFVIHGRDARLRREIFTFLRALGLQPIEWIEAMDLTGKASPYIGDILDAAFKRAQAAVVLLTPDDEARLREHLIQPGDPDHEQKLTGQARPNVLFEAGMAFASHPRQTVLVQFGHVKPFSDVAGRHIVKMDNSTQMRQELASKLKTAGCSVNMSGTDWQSVGDLTPPSEITKPSSPVAKEPNLVVKRQVYLGTLYLLGEIWSKTFPRGMNEPGRDCQYQAIYAEVKNAGKPGQQVGPVHDVKAELVIGYEEITPLPWLDQPENSVSFDFGTVRYVLLAVRMATTYSGDWRVVINHRDDMSLPGMRSMDFDHYLSASAAEQRIRLNLLHVETGAILLSVEGICKVNEGSDSGIPHIHFE